LHRLLAFKVDHLALVYFGLNKSHAATLRFGHRVLQTTPSRALLFPFQDCQYPSFRLFITPLLSLSQPVVEMLATVSMTVLAKISTLVLSHF
jgi:hypothetical protein